MLNPLVTHWSVPQSTASFAFFCRCNLQRKGQGGGAADPLLVAVVVDAHHESSAETDKGDNRLQTAAVGPQIHDANLCLGEAVGGFDGWLEGDPLLEEVEVAVSRGDAVEVLIGWGELNSFACKGVEGFEQEVVALIGKAFQVALGEPIVEEDGFGDGGVSEEW